MINEPFTPSLQELFQQCLKQKLIDEYEVNGEKVTIVRHEIVRFQLEHKQAHSFLLELLNGE